MFDEPFPEGYDRERFDQIVDEVEERARKVGLYLDGARLVSNPDPRLPEENLLFMTFRVGTVAFTDRVLDPEKDRVQDEIRGLEGDLAQDEQRDVKSELQADLDDLDEN